VAELQGRPPETVRPVRLDAAVDAYVPADYVPLEAVKIDLHRRVALAADRSELRELNAELADRFGPLPDPVANLLLLQEARLAAGELGAEALTLRGGRMTVAPLTLTSAHVAELKRVAPNALYTLARREVSRPVLEASQVLETLDAILEIRREIAA
jgi:transcription-repair coupling factor (superfamily II helicase)